MLKMTLQIPVAFFNDINSFSVNGDIEEVL